jgi:hypothetical protein
LTILKLVDLGADLPPAESMVTAVALYDPGFSSRIVVPWSKIRMTAS